MSLSPTLILRADIRQGSQKMVELEATHITSTREGAANRLACEVHPGILVIDRMGIHSAQTTAGSSTRCRPDRAARFSYWLPGLSRAQDRARQRS